MLLLSLTLLNKELKVILSYNNYTIGEFDLSKTYEYESHNEYVFLEFNPTTVEDYIKTKNYIKNSEIKRIRSNLCNEIMEYGYTGYIISKDELSSKEKSLKLLTLDRNFMNLLAEVKDEFNIYFNHFTSLMNNTQTK